MKVFQFLTFVLMCAAAPAWGQQKEGQHFAPGSVEQLRALTMFKSVPRLNELHRAALAGKERYHLLVDKSNFKALGLAKASDALSAQLGTPSKDYMVRLDGLKTYKSGDDPAKLLTDTGLVHYPLVYANKAVSTVTLAPMENRWEVVSIGDASRSRERSEARVELLKALREERDQGFLVRIPAFNLEFEGAYDNAGKLQLVSINNAPEWGLRTGSPVAAETLFLKLVPAARRFEDVPH